MLLNTNTFHFDIFHQNIYRITLNLYNQFVFVRNLIHLFMDLWLHPLKKAILSYHVGDLKTT